MSANNFFSYSRNVGAQYNVFHIEQICYLCCLFSILFKKMNFRSIYENCGANNRGANGYGNLYGLFGPNDISNPKIFGIENLGCGFEYIEGVILNNYRRRFSSSFNFKQYMKFTLWPRNTAYDYFDNYTMYSLLSTTADVFNGIHVYSNLYTVIPAAFFPQNPGPNNKGLLHIGLSNAYYYPLPGEANSYSNDYYVGVIGAYDVSITGIFNFYFHSDCRIHGDSYDANSGERAGGVYITHSFYSRLCSIPV